MWPVPHHPDREDTMRLCLLGLALLLAGCADTTAPYDNCRPIAVSAPQEIEILHAEMCVYQTPGWLP